MLKEIILGLFVTYKHGFSFLKIIIPNLRVRETEPVPISHFTSQRLWPGPEPAAGNTILVSHVGGRDTVM